MEGYWGSVYEEGQGKEVLREVAKGYTERE